MIFTPIPDKCSDCFKLPSSLAAAERKAKLEDLQSWVTQLSTYAVESLGSYIVYPRKESSYPFHILRFANEGIAKMVKA